MQEVTREMDKLTDHVGGQYVRAPCPGASMASRCGARCHSRVGRVRPLPSGAMFDRICQIVELGAITVANVHLSHGQLLNRRQLRSIAKVLPIVPPCWGDYNLIGPALLPGFRDVGPREPTHVAGDVVPLRIDRCL